MLNYIIDQVLVRNGRYMIGLWHSHPGQYNAPSHQDLTYCSQIIANDDSSGKQWNHFLAPITTFDATGSDVVSGWILPKGGSAFHSANVITDLCHDGNGRRFIESSEECEKSEGVLGTQNVAGDAGSGAQMDELDRIFETECSRRGEALGYIQRYHAQRKLSAARRILRARSA